MLSTKSYFRTGIATILFVALCGCFSGSVYAAPRAIANKKDLDVALKTAKTADDHQQIAAYYQQQAQKLQNKGKEEQELADYFQTLPGVYNKQYPTPYENHKWRADHYRQAASQALEKAGQHMAMAKELQTHQSLQATN
jgi:hypothetical protein